MIGGNIMPYYKIGFRTSLGAYPEEYLGANQEEIEKYEKKHDLYFIVSANSLEQAQKIAKKFEGMEIYASEYMGNMFLICEVDQENMGNHPDLLNSPYTINFIFHNCEYVQSIKCPHNIRSPYVKIDNAYKNCPLINNDGQCQYYDRHYKDKRRAIYE